ncbi:MAG: DNA repair protein RecO [Marinoscillum sp.]|uniref:DNA repair protein RecO n=1 Tax=Marinoscillum sp. TaxID=2024838 RepID=UPI0032FBEE61
MVTKTRGIVIKYLKYQESSIIVQIFTEHYGLMSFMVNGIRSPRSKRSIGYFQAFSLLELVAYIKPNRSIQRLSEYKYYATAHHIQQDIRKGTIVLFLSEILSKLLTHEQGESHERLFAFLSNAIITFDSLQSEIENFHLHFLLKMLPFVGLDVEDGTALVHSMELEMIEEDHNLITFISSIISSDYTEPVQGSGALRFKALELILNYYEHHTTQLGEIKSLKVLHQVFR